MFCICVGGMLIIHVLVHLKTNMLDMLDPVKSYEEFRNDGM